MVALAYLFSNMHSPKQKHHLRWFNKSGQKFKIGFKILVIRVMPTFFSSKSPQKEGGFLRKKIDYS
ncbi:MAG: hypothetical protein AAGI23_17165, partial [Bacteroidota bacterium]